MGLERGFLGKMDKARDDKLGRTPDEPLAESMGDSINSEDLTLYLTATGKKSDLALLDRYRTGKTTEADEVKLAAKYQEYLERRKNGETVLGTLEDYTSDMVKNSPEFKMLSKLHGAENIDEVLKKGLLMRALKDPKKFAVIQAEFQKLRDFEENVEKPLNKRVEDWCKSNNISTEDGTIKNALLETNPSIRQGLIHDELMKGFTFKQHLWDMTKGIFGGGTAAQARALSREDISGILAQRDQLTQEAGVHARNLLVKDKEFREALARMRVGEEPPFEGGGESMMKFEDAKGFKLDMKATSEALNDFLTKKGRSIGDETLPKKWGTLTEREQEPYLEEFWNGNTETDPEKAWDGYRDRFPRPKGGGIMATLLSFMFGKDFYKNEEFKEGLNKYETDK